MGRREKGAIFAMLPERLSKGQMPSVLIQDLRVPFLWGGGAGKGGGVGCRRQLPHIIAFPCTDGPSVLREDEQLPWQSSAHLPSPDEPLRVIWIPLLGATVCRSFLDEKTRVSRCNKTRLPFKPNIFSACPKSRPCGALRGQDGLTEVGQVASSVHDSVFCFGGTVSLEQKKI